MYQYFNGLVIRECTEGVPADQVEAFRRCRMGKEYAILAEREVYFDISKLNLGIYSLGSK